ncbi:MAG: GspE/PulE family protein [Candidatus Omnitrophica bacterium]|nr:GspE/PulE family protein [Candidatus Omnitrophota bacterium]
MATLSNKILEILVKTKRISLKQKQQVLSLKKQKDSSIKDILINEGFISNKELLAVLSEEFRLPPLDLSKYKIDAEIIKIIPERLARQHHLICVSQIGSTITVAMSDPLNIFALDDLRILTKKEIDPVISTESDINKAIEKYYCGDVVAISSLLDEGDKTAEVLSVDGEQSNISAVIEESQKAPIVKVVDLIIAEALYKRASDIHVEPAEEGLRVRYRIDGNLYDTLTLPKSNQNAILARLKIMSGLDITESRLPQDGRFKIRLESKEIDFRVSALPTTFGQKFVLRALDKSSLSMGLDKLGFFPERLALFKQAIAKPYGMILVTGPTGSGKSTTLYSILNRLNTMEKNIITVEDPVEYQIEGITQIHVKPEIGLTFAAGLRSILRQSPDIIMIGEIRDSETADIAVRASLIGQLVFSTLHTNDAAGAITRLIDMGVEPFLVASSIIMTCAQRLCRKICNACKEPVEIPDSILKKLTLRPTKTDTFYAGRGCNHCNNTGYFGRLAALEVLMIDDNICRMILKKSSSDQIKEYAIKNNGMQTIWDDMMRKLKMGATTYEEVLRVAIDT